MAAERSEKGKGRGAESGSESEANKTNDTNETNEAKSKNGIGIETGIESRSGDARLLQGAPEGGANYNIAPNKLYPVDFVAELLSVEPKVVRWWIRKHKVEGFRLPNGAWRVRGSEIIALLERSRVQ